MALSYFSGLMYSTFPAFTTDLLEILPFSSTQSLQEFDPGKSVFDATKWTDLSDGFNGKWKKKVNIQFLSSL